jgi:hypothetical protein
VGPQPVWKFYRSKHRASTGTRTTIDQFSNPEHKNNHAYATQAPIAQEHNKSKVNAMKQIEQRDINKFLYSNSIPTSQRLA